MDTTVGPSANLAVTIESPPTSAVQGGDLTYTVKVTNSGPASATGVTLTEGSLAGQGVVVGATASQGTVNVADPLVADLGSLAVGASATVTITAAPTSLGTFAPSFTAASNQADVLPANSTATLSIPVLSFEPVGVVAESSPNILVPAPYDPTAPLPAITPDGQFIAFSSTGSDIVPGIVDTGGYDNIYVLDGATGITTLVSSNAAGTATGNGNSTDPSISADGQYVAFLSDAGDLANGVSNGSGNTGGSGITNLYVRDLLTNKTTLASATTAGTLSLAGIVASATMSQSGQFVVVDSDIPKLVAGENDPAGVSQVFVYNVQTGATRPVSENAAGTGAGNAGSSVDAISGNSQFVLFDSSATNLVSGLSTPDGGVFRQDLLTGQTELVSINSEGTAAGNGTFASGESISDDGNLIAFRSDATDLVAGTISYTSSASELSNIFVRNMETATTQLVSIDPTGTEANNTTAVGGTMSGDGTEIAFYSDASNLLPSNGPTINGIQLFVRNLTTGTTSLASVTTTGNSDQQAFPINPPLTVSLSDDGRYLLFVSASNELVPGNFHNNSGLMVLIRDLLAGTTSCVDVGPNGNPTAGANGGEISGNGQYVVFGTGAGGLVQDAGNGGLFVRNLTLGQTQAIALVPDSVNVEPVGGPYSEIFDGGEDPTYTQNVALSADGSEVAYASFGTDLTPDIFEPADEAENVFATNLSTGATTLVSAGPSGADETGLDPSISADGQKVAFESGPEVYVPNLSTGLVTEVSEDAAGTGDGNGGSELPAISANGEFVAFLSEATNLVSGITSGYIAGDYNVFVRNLTTGVTQLVSVDSAGTAPANNITQTFNDDTFPVLPPQISADGSLVLFFSEATNLVAGVTETVPVNNVFVRDMVTGVTQLVSETDAGTAAGVNDPTPLGGGLDPGLLAPPAMTPDGQFVVFVSKANNIVPGISDPSGTANVYLRNLQTGVTTLVSVDPAGTAAGNGDSGYNDFFIGGVVQSAPAVSPDGEFVAFWSTATNLVANGPSAGLYVRNMQTGQTTLITDIRDYDSTLAFSSNDQLVFASSGALVPGMQAGGSTSNVFVYNALSGALRLASTTTAGLGGDGDSIAPVISSEGSTVVFVSGASDLVPGVTPNFANITPNTCLYVYNNTISSEVEQFAFSSPIYSVVQNQASATITIQRLFGNSGTATVTFSTANGTATSGTDYTGGSQTVTFAAGETSATVTIPIDSESAFTGNRTVDLTLSNPSAGAALGTQPTAVLDIDGNGISGRDDAVEGTVSSGGNTYDYTAALNGVLTVGLFPCGGDWTLTVTDAHGNSSSSSGSGYQEVDLLATAGEVYTINVSSESAGGTFTADVINLISRVQTGAGDVLQVSGGGDPLNIGIGTNDVQSTGTGDPLDMVISSPLLPADTDYAASTLSRSNLLGTAPFVGVQAVDFLSDDSLFLDPSVTLPVTVSGVATVTANTTAGASVTFNPLASDGSIPLSVSAVTTPADGSATINANGTIVYTPKAGFTGTDTFQFTAADAFGGSGTATVTVTVTGQSNPGLPTSSVNPLPATESSASFTVSWSGSDVSGGGGIASYDVFVSDDGAPFTAFETNTTQTSATFNGASGHTYGFYSVATDKAGKVQPTPTAAQATTTVAASSASAPTSTVSALPAVTSSPSFTVSWSGSPGAGASSIVSYEIFFSVDGDLFAPLIQSTTNTSTTFTGEAGFTYSFFSVATNNLGLVQPTPSGAQATTTVSGSNSSAPTSTVNPLPAVTTTASFILSWSGAPGAEASKIVSYKIFFSVNGGPFTPLLINATLTSLTFTGVAGDTYGFFSVATNNLGLVQPTPTTAQATTTVIGPPPPVPPTIIGEKAIFTRKTNKKDKPVGSAVLAGFSLEFSASLNQATATNAANYELDTITTKKVKKRVKTILHPITSFKVSYSATSDSVNLTLLGKQTFPTGGQLTIVNRAPGGVEGATGALLAGKTVFAIAKKGRTITPSNERVTRADDVCAVIGSRCAIFLSWILCAMIATNPFTLASTPNSSSGEHTSCDNRCILRVGGRSFWAGWLGRLLSAALPG